MQKNVYKAAWEFIKRLSSRKSFYIPLLFSIVPLNLAHALLQAYLPKRVVEIPAADNFMHATIMLALVIFVVGVLSILLQLYKLKMMVSSRDLRLKTMGEINQCSLHTPYHTFMIEQEMLQYSEGLTNISTEDCVIAHTPQAFAAGISDVVSIIVSLGFIINIHPLLLVVIVAAAAVQLLYARHIQKFRQTMNKQRHQNHIAFNYFDRFSRDEQSAKDVRIFGLTQTLRGRLNHALSQINTAYKNLSFKNCIAASITVILTFVRDYLAHLFLVAQFLNGQINIGNFVFLIELVRVTSQLTDTLTSQISTLRSNSDACQKMNALYEKMDSVLQSLLPADSSKVVSGEGNSIPANIPANMAASQMSIVFDHVSFSYDPDKEPVIKDMSFTIESGEKIALVGNNGAGKSTIIALLLGLLEPQSGTIYLDGRSIQEITPQERRALFGTVLQASSLTPVSCANFVSGRSALTEQEEARVWEMLDRVSLKERFEREEKGINTMLMPAYTGDGTNLSGGEVQRLLLACVLYHSAPILLLDEPSAALDPLAEKRLYELYTQELGDKTSIFISHRLGSTAFCDRILFVEQGTIAESGTHQSLLEANGKYAELYNTQAQYYVEDSVEDYVEDSVRDRAEDYVEGSAEDLKEEAHV